MATSRAKKRKRSAGGGRDKRGQVIDAAVELFLANGFDQTSMDAIAAHAGVSKTTVYAHYDDKLALFRSVVERSASELAVKLDEARLASDQDPETRLTAILLTVLQGTTADEFRAFMRVMVTESVRHEDLVYVMQGAGSPDLIGLVADTLEAQADRGGYSIENPRLFATILLRMAVAGPQIDCLLFPKFRSSAPLLESHAKWVASIFLRGIEPRGKDSSKVAPPAGGYNYPWLPEVGL
jgi:TetR/AcrR family transcriptional repressor of mexJK operon